jgi:hypothetical protein
MYHQPWAIGKITSENAVLSSGKRLQNYGKSPFWMGKSTISMAMFNDFLYVYQRVMFINTKGD